MATGRKKSPIWEFFVVAEDTKIAICKACKVEVPRGGQSTKSFTTTNLVHHLKSKHADDYSKYNELKEANTDKQQRESLSLSGTPVTPQLKQISLAEMAERRKVWDINDLRAKTIHTKLGEMIAIDCQPVSIVDHNGFKALVHALEPKYRIPSRKYFSETVIPGIAKKIRTQIETKLQEDVEYISFTTDVWSSDINSDSLLGFTAHWVDNKFQRRSAVLQAQELSERHTGEYIAIKITKMLSDWNISIPNVHVVIRDNGSNMVKAMAEANLPNFGCFAHTLQLVVHDGLLSQRVVKDLLSICRSIVGHFKHSSVACLKLANIQENLDLPKHRLKQDVTTRWNSTLYMVESILEQKMALAAYAAENNIPQLTPNQLEIARKMVLVLSPVEEITQSISKETATLSVVIPNIRALLRSWEKQEDDLGIRTMKEEMVKSLKSRFAGVEENMLLSIATLLDPRFKDKFFGSNIIKTTVKEMLEEEVQKIIDNDRSHPSQSQESQRSSPSQSAVLPVPKRPKKDTLLTMLSEIIEDSGASDSNTSASDEVERFLGEPVVDYKLGNPFKWWCEHKARFPILAQLARRFLSGTATSVPSERLFSQAGIVYEEHRNRILPENAETLLFIKGNYALFDIE